MEVLPGRIQTSFEFRGKSRHAVDESQNALRSPSKKHSIERNQTSDQAPPTKMSQQKFMAVYKVNECKKKFNHDKRQCMNWHSQADRRRNPFHVGYTTTECEKGLYCKDYSKCLYSHNMLEKMFHPDLFQITRCSRGPNSSPCERGDFCAFAHSEEELRQPSSAKDKATGSGSPLSLSTTFDSDQHPRHRSPNGGSGPISCRSAGHGGTDGLSPSKPLPVDSAALESIQRNLVTLIKSQGIDGIISSELPKRYFDHFGSRLDLQDEHGEKFRIKDILHNQSDVTVSMHKGVQPKYLYTGPDPSPTSRSGRGGTASSASASSATVVNGETQLIGGEVGGGDGRGASFTFLAAASSTDRGDDKVEKKWSGVSCHAGGQPAFSPSGIGHSGIPFSPNGGSGVGLHSPFFPDSSSSSSSSSSPPTASSSSQDGLNGLLGSAGSSSSRSLKSSLVVGGESVGGQRNDFNTGLISPPRDKQLSSSSYLESTFSFPMFEKDCLGFGDDNNQKDVQLIEFSRQLNDKNMEINQKNMEIEDLKTKLQDFQRLHHEACLKHDKEKRLFQAKITQLHEKCTSLEDEKLNQAQDDSGGRSYDSHLQFPQNAFPMSSLPEPFSPQRSSPSSSSPSTPSPSSRNWVSDNRVAGAGAQSNNFGFSPRNHHQQLSPGSLCGHHGCSAEGTYWCSGCNRVGYCGAEHQAAHWECAHKNECGLYE